MRTTRNHERYVFISMMTRALPKIPPHHVVDLAEAIMRSAGILDRYAVNRCNRETTPRENNRAVRVRESLVKLIREKAPGLQLLFGGDPRGYVVKLKFPNGAHNTMGGPEEGYGVPVGN